MRIGARVVVTKEIDLSPHAIISQGETGEVTRIDATGEIWITMDDYHHGLGEWENCIWVNEYTEDISSAIAYVELSQAA